MHQHTSVSGVVGPALYRALLFFIAGLPIVAYFGIVACLHRNLPIADDLIVELELVQLLNAPTLTEKLRILFSQLNEHRLVYVRGCFWLINRLNGQLSFSALIAIGNLALLGVWVLLVRLLRQLTIPIICWLPVSWILFQFQFYDNTLEAMASLQNFTVHLLYLLLFILIVNPDRRAWWGAWFVAGWLCYTSGNGFLALALAGAGLLVQHRWRDAGAWLLLSLGLILCYFIGYQRPANFPVADAYTLFDKLGGVLIFLGAYLNIHSFTNTYSEHLCYGLLIVVPVLTMSGWLALRLWHTRPQVRLELRAQLSLITLLLVGFLLLSAGAVVEGRLAFTGWGGLLVTRYGLYSAMFVITGYCQLIIIARQQGWRLRAISYPVLILCMVCWAGIFQNRLSEMYLFRSQALAFYFNFTQLKSAELLQQVAPVFVPPEAEQKLLDQLESELSKPAEAVGDSLYQSLLQRDSGVFIENQWFPNSSRPQDWVWLVLQATDHTLLFPTRRFPNLGLRSFWLRRIGFGKGFEIEVPRHYIRQQQSYRAGLIIHQNDTMKVYQTSQVVQPYNQLSP